ncbi:hypothetical protein KIH31_01815 [Paenarthrobacter sp. DKR-5]|uniref:hypothetical protein n=1 Tax=Paenarthrobacter sp. DKR-5 TaxID=2835535 RepID=UPI001BDD8048|nr:hypothetical protein [Paenarthrobacter sp. DKR-5]MBT1001327.1 hypothetical protein [Paenarthrobacter sp. DKR-5]
MVRARLLPVSTVRVSTVGVSTVGVSTVLVNAVRTRPRRAAAVAAVCLLLAGCTDWNEPGSGTPSPAWSPSSPAAVVRTPGDGSGGPLRSRGPLPTARRDILVWADSALPEGGGQTFAQAFAPLAGGAAAVERTLSHLPVGTYRMQMACLGEGRVNFSVAAAARAGASAVLIDVDVDCGTTATRLISISADSVVTITVAARGEDAVTGYRLARV